MKLSPKISQSYSNLRDTLNALLRAQNPKLYEPYAENYPLLVLETYYDAVGFVIVNNDPELAFSAAYESFKQHYRLKHNEWVSRNISFVICRLDSKVKDDSFYNSKEMDVYFCRKYVVIYKQSKDELTQELLRLPFLPLREGVKGGILRPPSAQTLLQSMNISAPIAAQIIVPQKASAKSIVNDLLNENQLPEIGAKIDFDTQQQIRATGSTRIKSISIEAFRAYRKNQVFDVDSDVVVLYGPNGLGKTSFFDAIDYVCTGRIGRFDRNNMDQNNFVELARHLGSTAAEGSVSMKVSNGGEEHTIIRTITNWNTALVDENKRDRVSTLQFLASAQEESKIRIENLERLFRATHLFGQSDPELLKGFDQSSMLSADIVNRMFALDDYASGQAKIQSVLSDLDKRIIESTSKTKEIENLIANLQSQINLLPKPQNNTESSKQINEIVTSLKKDLQSFGMKVESAKADQQSAREWRALVGMALMKAELINIQLEKGESDLVRFSENKKSLENITINLVKYEETLKEIMIQRQQQQEAKRKLKNSLDQTNTSLNGITSKLHSLLELPDLQELFQINKKSLERWQLELKRLTIETEENVSELRPLYQVLENFNNRTTKLREEIESKLKQIQTLTAINERVPVWMQECVSLKNAKKEIINTQSEIHSLIDKNKSLKHDITIKEKELALSEKEYTNHAENERGIARLLDEIENHVKDGICPTCGNEHKSKAELIKRIRAQKKSRPIYIEALAKRCNELSKQLKEDKSIIETLNKRHASLEAELKEKSNYLEILEKSIQSFVNSVDENSFNLDLHIGEKISQKIIVEKKAHLSMKEKLFTIEQEQNKTLVNLKKLELKQSQLDKAVKRANTAVLPLRKQRDTLLLSATTAGLELDMTGAEIDIEKEKLEAQCKISQDKIKWYKSQIDIRSKGLFKIDTQFKDITEKSKKLLNNKVKINEEMERFKETYSRILDRKNITHEAIMEAAKLAKKRVDSLRSLEERCLNLERLLDAASRSITWHDLEAQIQILAKERRALDDNIKKLSSTRKWCVSVKNILDKQSSIAVSNYVEGYGPLTSLLQKRLRAVYGFGDINLFSKSNEIHVDVRWENAHVRPADYFSDSQKQILMLSLFLAARLTQTWSGFAPILLDDPVTHFDDLNAFAFVELIRGLVSTSPGKRQFFISTCDERLYELMLKKFKGIKGGAKYYRFGGIGHDGPNIRSIEKID